MSLVSENARVIESRISNCVNVKVWEFLQKLTSCLKKFEGYHFIRETAFKEIFTEVQLSMMNVRHHTLDPIQKSDNTLPVN